MLFPTMRDIYELYNKCVNIIINNKTMSKEQEVKTPTAEVVVDKKQEALKVLQEEETANIQKCSAEVSAALQKYGYGLEIQQTIVLKKVAK